VAAVLVSEKDIRMAAARVADDAYVAFVKLALDGSLPIAVTDAIRESAEREIRGAYTGFSHVSRSESSEGLA
jgi:hypothetical protein